MHRRQAHQFCRVSDTIKLAEQIKQFARRGNTEDASRLSPGAIEDAVRFAHGHADQITRTCRMVGHVAFIMAEFNLKRPAEHIDPFILCWMNMRGHKCPVRDMRMPDKRVRAMQLGRIDMPDDVPCLFADKPVGCCYSEFHSYPLSFLKHKLAWFWSGFLSSLRVKNFKLEASRDLFRLTIVAVNEMFLPSFAVLRTRNLDEARDAVAQRYCDHRLNLVRGRKVDVSHNHVRGSHVSLNLLGYGGDVAIDPGELQDFYLLQIPLAGAARIAHRQEQVDATPDCATILNPDRPTKMEWRHDCIKLMMQIDAAFLHRVARENTDAPLPGQIRFAPTVDLTRDQGQFLKRMAITSAQAFEAGTLPPASQDLQLMATEREIALALLHHQPNNMSHLFAAAPPPMTPRSIRRALDFMHAHFSESIRLDDIAKATGQHPRTLQIGFRRALGKSPMAYLRDLRLDTAKFHLSRRQNRPRISDVAYDCGFSHLGRFSRDFRARFGQTPSDWNGS